MGLNSSEILRYIALSEDDSDRIRISNLDSRCIRPNGIDYRASPIARYVDPDQEPYFLSIEKPQYLEITKEPGEYFHVMPGEYLLLQSIQEFEYWPKNLIGRVSMRSTNHRSAAELNFSQVIETKYPGGISWGVTTQVKKGIKVLPGTRMIHIEIEQVNPLGMTETYGSNASKYLDRSPESKEEETIEAELILKGDLEALLEEFKMPSQG